MGQIVLCARVARHLAGRAYYDPRERPISPPAAAALAAERLPLDYPGMLKFALHSLSVYLDLGFSSLQWLETVLTASHFGSSFRRCFFFAYKEQRSPYPRVTNRGVQASATKSNARVRKGRLDA